MCRFLSFRRPVCRRVTLPVCVSYQKVNCQTVEESSQTESQAPTKIDEESTAPSPSDMPGRGNNNPVIQKGVLPPIRNDKKQIVGSRVSPDTSTSIKSTTKVIPQTIAKDEKTESEKKPSVAPAKTANIAKTPTTSATEHTNHSSTTDIDTDTKLSSTQTLPLAKKASIATNNRPPATEQTTSTPFASLPRAKTSNGLGKPVYTDTKLTTTSRTKSTIVPDVAPVKTSQIAKTEIGSITESSNRSKIPVPSEEPKNAESLTMAQIGKKTIARNNSADRINDTTNTSPPSVKRAIQTNTIPSTALSKVAEQQNITQLTGTPSAPTFDISKQPTDNSTNSISNNTSRIASEEDSPTTINGNTIIKRNRTELPDEISSPPTSLIPRHNMALRFPDQTTVKEEISGVTTLPNVAPAKTSELAKTASNTQVDTRTTLDISQNLREDVDGNRFKNAQTPARKNSADNMDTRAAHTELARKKRPANPPPTASDTEAKQEYVAKAVNAPSAQTVNISKRSDAGETTQVLGNAQINTDLTSPPMMTASPKEIKTAENIVVIPDANNAKLQRTSNSTTSPSPTQITTAEVLLQRSKLAAFPRRNDYPPSWTATAVIARFFAERLGEYSNPQAGLMPQVLAEVPQAQTEAFNRFVEAYISCENTGMAALNAKKDRDTAITRLAQMLMPAEDAKEQGINNPGIAIGVLEKYAKDRRSATLNSPNKDEDKESKIASIDSYVEEAKSRLTYLQDRFRGLKTYLNTEQLIEGLDYLVEQTNLINFNTAAARLNWLNAPLNFSASVENLAYLSDSIDKRLTELQEKKDDIVNALSSLPPQLEQSLRDVCDAIDYYRNLPIDITTEYELNEAVDKLSSELSQKLGINDYDVAQIVQDSILSDEYPSEQIRNGITALISQNNKKVVDNFFAGLVQLKDKIAKAAPSPLENETHKAIAKFILAVHPTMSLSPTPLPKDQAKELLSQARESIKTEKQGLGNEDERFKVLIWLENEIVAYYGRLYKEDGEVDRKTSLAANETTNSDSKKPPAAPASENAKTDKPSDRPLTTEQLACRHSVVGLTPEQINRLSPVNTNTVDGKPIRPTSEWTDEIGMLTEDQVRKLSAAQLERMSPQQVALFSGRQLQLLNPRQILALFRTKEHMMAIGDNFKYFRPQVIKENTNGNYITPKLISWLNIEQRKLSSKQVGDLNQAQLQAFITTSPSGARFSEDEQRTIIRNNAMALNRINKKFFTPEQLEILRGRLHEIKDEKA